MVMQCFAQKKKKKKSKMKENKTEKRNENKERERKNRVFLEWKYAVCSSDIEERFSFFFFPPSVLKIRDALLSQYICGQSYVKTIYTVRIHIHHLSVQGLEFQGPVLSLRLHANT